MPFLVLARRREERQSNLLECRNFILQGAIMSKIQQSNKEVKKQSVLTAKEKKAAKQIKQGKKQAPDVSRLIPR